MNGEDPQNYTCPQSVRQGQSLSVLHNSCRNRKCVSVWLHNLLLVGQAMLVEAEQSPMWCYYNYERAFQPVVDMCGSITKEQVNAGFVLFPVWPELHFDTVRHCGN
ncbi:hypothetical protein V1264_010954 [Littorina saxatilis]|uniref:Uncharacterized protein n=1 Tax=Littorina saxatilis TaxID=31220 RepID=A0AAN9BSK2_9CAEN